jgi:hypothetical protein
MALNNALPGVHRSDSGAMSATIGSWPKPTVALCISPSVSDIRLSDSHEYHYRVILWPNSVVPIITIGSPTQQRYATHHCQLTFVGMNSSSDGGF